MEGDLGGKDFVGNRAEDEEQDDVAANDGQREVIDHHFEVPCII